MAWLPIWYWWMAILLQIFQSCILNRRRSGKTERLW